MVFFFYFRHEVVRCTEPACLVVSSFGRVIAVHGGLRLAEVALCGHL